MSTPKEKVLIITYYWPPAGGPGVQRWLKFVKYLPDFDVVPYVYVPENPSYPIQDAGLLREVSEQAIVIKKKIREPYQWAALFSKKSTQKISSGIIPAARKQSVLQKFLLWVRGNIFIPDARFLWVKPSVHFLKKYIEKEGITTIITSGPPHSLHLIGQQLRASKQVKWIADFRDPWTTIGYHKALKLSRYAAKIHRDLERQVLQSADHILVTSPTTKEEFSALTSRPISVITNGYDTEEVPPQTLDTSFTLAHIGSFLSDRNPTILWEVLAELVHENPQFATDFSLKLIGKISEEVLQSISHHKLDAYVNNLGYVAHDEAVAHQRKSQVLLLIEIDSPDTRSIIPGKLFEYMVSGRPIVALGPKGSDFAEIVQSTNTGTFFTYTEKVALKQKISELYAQYQAGRLQTHPVGLQRYSRKQLTQALVQLIHSV
ncbi:glycosyltransferase family 4 protein [Flavobacterium sp.]|jgi:glycosyltransferase involved in cell wall biosynthesis|uniref:glycosyltransferase family 4 protein n=2 Tax=Flavobacterium sp. TaxID=239 RepID=UPI0022BC4497|nr:glycosyltransferase family 4 protein [Flavobacterium sp.]MCZ8144950.1 glycosyltransferase family 4 protein [Flavobacterium sp.]MCZ8367571.1 glycosyltransferase family 4 protein [Flavobacterium sp.]